MDSLFLDTSFIVALEDADDQHHKNAITFWNNFKRDPKRIVTTSYVFDETVTFLKRRINHEKAAEVGNLLISSQSVEIVHISEMQFDKGWKMFLRFSDKGFSFTDCLSFLVMDERGTKEALTFDEHFKQRGFKVANPL